MSSVKTSDDTGLLALIGTTLLLLVLTFVYHVCTTSDNHLVQNTAAPNEYEPLAMIVQAIKTTPLDTIASSTELKYGVADSKFVRQAVWGQYMSQQQTEATRLVQVQTSTIQINNVTMKYFIQVIGETNSAGLYPLYICLHGGGSVAANVNEDQWVQMQTYYQKGVKSGIYVAPRAITNTWDMHWVPSAFPFYDRIIEDMVLFHRVDANQVYLLGYSAGGDGVYQISARMSDRWAASNASAGQPNGVSVVNYANTTVVMQAGDEDTAYNRNTVAVQYASTLDISQEQYPGLYNYQMLEHCRRGHDFEDNLGRDSLTQVYSNPEAWLSGTDLGTVELVADAPTIVTRTNRNPLPSYVVWDLTTQANTRQGNRNALHYWLDAGSGDAGKLICSSPQVIVSADPSINKIQVLQANTYLKLWLSSSMFNLAQPFTVVLGLQNITFTLQQLSLQTVIQSLLARGDPNYMFEAAITLQQQAPNTSWDYTIQ